MGLKYPYFKTICAGEKNPHHQQSAETAARNSYWSNALRINASTSQRDRKESKRWGRSAGSHSEVSSRQAWFMHGQYGHPCPACPVLWLTGGSDTPAPAMGDTPSPGAQPGSTDSGTGVWRSTSPHFSFPPCYATVKSLFFCNAFQISLTVILRGISTLFILG